MDRCYYCGSQVRADENGNLFEDVGLPVDYICGGSPDGEHHPDLD